MVTRKAPSKPCPGQELHSLQLENIWDVKTTMSMCTAENSQLIPLSQAEPSLTKRSRKAVTEQNYLTENEDSLFPMNLYQALKKANIVCYKVQEFCNDWGKKIEELSSFEYIF